MALLRNYNRLSGIDLKDFSVGVIKGLNSSPLFSSLAAAVAILTTLKDELDNSLLSFSQSTKSSDDIMLLNKAKVVKQLDVIRKPAEELCGGDEAKECLTGFTPHKRGRTHRTSIAAAKVKSALSNGVAKQLVITLLESVPGNVGYEVHCIVNGDDRIIAIARLRSRSLKLLVTGFPSAVPLKIYLITLGKSNLRSLPSNSVTGMAI